MSRQDPELLRRISDLIVVTNELSRRVALLEKAIQDKAPGLWPNPKEQVKANDSQR